MNKPLRPLCSPKWKLLGHRTGRHTQGNDIQSIIHIWVFSFEENLLTSSALALLFSAKKKLIPNFHFSVLSQWICTCGGYALWSRGPFSFLLSTYLVTSMKRVQGDKEGAWQVNQNCAVKTRREVWLCCEPRQVEIPWGGTKLHFCTFLVLCEWLITNAIGFFS